MRIFVGYHFDPRDQWIKDLVYPLIRAFGDEVVTGETLYGQREIGPAVTRKIRESHALIGFATRRDQSGPGEWSTHRWITDEIAQANAYELPIVEVRELGVDPQRGIVGGTQFIAYNEDERDKCMVEIVKAMGEFHRAGLMKLQLLPEEFTQEIAPLLGNPRFRSVYRVYLDGDDEPSEERQLKILELKGGLFATVRNFPPGAFVQVRVECEAKLWASVFESTDAISIRLRKG
jgi:hypothetical protein